jgi:hypothetical protein
MRRLIVALTLVAATMLAPSFIVHAQTFIVHAQTATTTTTTVATADDGQVAQTKSVIPKPNSGSAPQQAGDRGGALQIGLFGVLVLALAFIGAVIIRSTMRNSRVRDAALQKGSSPRDP